MLCAQLCSPDVLLNLVASYLLSVYISRSLSQQLCYKRTEAGTKAHFQLLGGSYTYRTHTMNNEALIIMFVALCVFIVIGACAMYCCK